MAVLEYICSEANKLTNCGIYYCRQMLFKAGKFLTRGALDKELKSNIHFQAMRSACAQQTLHSVIESFYSYGKLLKLYREEKLHFRPKPPSYRKKGGMEIVTYPAQWVKLIDGQLKFTLGNQVKAWFGIDHFFLPMPSNLEFNSIKEYRILPRNRCFYIEFVYNQQEIKPVEDNGNVLGIDPGLNNWITGVSNTGKSFIIDGKKVKSQNQWYNKQVAKLKMGKSQGYWDDALAEITEKRNRQMRDNINKAARFIVNWCLANNIANIVFGWNPFNKDGINIGKKNNQEFVQIPTAKLKDRIFQLSQQYGINLIETEESYTSQASFLDNDFLPKYGEKPKRWKASGKRVKRGLYQSSDGSLINADCNGASNIMRKVRTQLNLDLTKVCKVVLTLPKRYFLDSLSKKYRKRCEGGFNPLTASA
ncbi:transposase [Okeania sp. SIO2C2]|uniref:RNA-guided endonuclease InsQ/TnpB family protein n=1 Tax=Okeania sp. SIO2C2 TaxID=2607787 RepID=UPI002580A1E8|nr:transposase [Okeania sp. SIO2C2]